MYKKIAMATLILGPILADYVSRKVPVVEAAREAAPAPAPVSGDALPPGGTARPPVIHMAVGSPRAAAGDPGPASTDASLDTTPSLLAPEPGTPPAPGPAAAPAAQAGPVSPFGDKGPPAELTAPQL